MKSVYCKKCGCCGEIDCCGLEKFLSAHTRKCKYHEWYVREILNDAKNLALIYEKLYEWADKTGHDRCFWHPDILESLCKILNIPVVSTKLPPRCEFEEGCRKYQDEIYGDVPL